MSFVLCGCCDKYCVIYEDTTERGLCELCNRVISAYDEVCEEFIMRKGYYTKRAIPDYCKNYK